MYHGRKHVFWADNFDIYLAVSWHTHNPDEPHLPRLNIHDAAAGVDEKKGKRGEKMSKKDTPPARG